MVAHSYKEPVEDIILCNYIPKIVSVMGEQTHMCPKKDIPSQRKDLKTGVLRSSIPK
jgi:hypothetical protein